VNAPPSGDGGARLALAGAAALALGLLWLAGALSAALFGAGWTPIPAAQTITVAIHLPSHLGDPRAAWPAPARRSLPGPLGFYLTLALLLVALAALALWAGRLAERLGPALKGAGRDKRPASARWASGRDLRALVVRGPERGRLVLGRHGRRLLAAEQRASVIVIAPAQSGKTTGLAIPALREWDGPVLATSVKSDLLLDTLDDRKQVGRTMVFDPVGATAIRETISSDPLRECGSWEGALRVAHWLSSAARQGDGLSDSEFWYAAAEKLLAPLLHAAALEKRSIGAVVRWLDKGKGARKDVEAVLAKGEKEATPAQLAWQANWGREERQRSSIYTTAETIVAAFADPRVQHACRREAGGYSPAALLDEPNTLYLCAPAHEQKRLRPLFSMMIRELVSLVYERAARRGGPIEPPLLLVLDELANVAPVPGLDEIASTGAGQGIQLLSVFQDMAQVQARYGEGALTIVNNHRAKLFGTGVSDPDTLSYVSRVVGAGEFRDESATADDRGSSTRTEGSIYRELTPANVVREGEPGSALLLYGHLPPTRIRLRLPSKREKLNRSSADDQRPGRPSKGEAAP
jgi:type IV secretion system protein VirD4